MQIHSFDAVVSEKEAMILEVSAVCGVINHFTLTVKPLLFMAALDDVLYKIALTVLSFLFSEKETDR